MMNHDALAMFREGLAELLFVDRRLGAIARSIGEPFWDSTIPTAAVRYNPESKDVSFLMNPEFAAEQTIETMAGSIAHETFHIILSHLLESMDDKYSDKQALINAHECIINDNLKNVLQLELPEWVIYGEKLLGLDTSPYSTDEVYAMFAQKPEDSESGEGDDNESSENSGQSDSQDSNSSSGSSENDDTDSGPDEGTESGGAGGGESEANSASDSDDQVTGACSGYVASDDTSPVQAQDVKDAYTNVMVAAAQDMGMDYDDFINVLNNTVARSYNPAAGDAGITEAKVGAERMAWFELLAEINPKVLEAGSPRRKSRNNWTRTNRRMSSVYPKVILPRSEAVEPKKDDKGDTLPVFVIALDLSGSIDKGLVKMLQGLLEDIPEKLIKAYPCTWSSNCVPYVDQKVVNSAGTNIDSVVNYVKQVAAETGSDPYVLCITDGQYHRPSVLPGKKWYYMGVDNASVHTLKNGYRGYSYNSRSTPKFIEPGDKVYHVNDFRKVYGK